MAPQIPVFLDIETKQSLEELAQLTNRSISDLVREFVVEKVKVVKKKKSVKKSRHKKMTGVEALLRMSESAKRLAKKYNISGPTDLSINHDHYLYGAPKKVVQK